MSISVQNNLMALHACNILSQNVNKKDRAAAHLSSGEKLTSAGEGASEYAISDRMKVLIRSLGQDDENVQTGTTLLHVAEGGVQQQIELLKGIKAKVLDANNDTNTDEDRAIIQKEIDQRYAEINDISVETSYNGKLVLHGNHVKDVVRSWAVLDAPIEIEGSDSLNLIPNNYGSLNGKTGPFDVFSPYTTEPVIIDTLGLTGTGALFQGGTASTPATWKIDLGQVGLGSGTLPDVLNNRGFSFYSPYYNYGTTISCVLTTSDDTAYNSASLTKINISGCDTMDSIAAKIAETLNGKGIKVTTDGAKLSFETNYVGSSNKSTSYPMKDLAINGGTVPEHTATVSVPVYTNIAGTAGTGRIGSTSLSGGADAIGSLSDADYHAATTASYSVDLSSAAANTGFTVSAYGTYYYRLVSGNTSSWNSTDGVYDVGTSFNGMVSNNGYASVTMKNGTLTVTADYGGAYGNSFAVKDGIEAHTVTTYKSETVNVPQATYTAVTELGVPGQTDSVDGKDGDKATYTIDLSAYKAATDADTLESFISSLAGKSIHLSTGVNYEFIDKNSTEIDNRQQVNGSTVFELNSLRTAVTGSKTIAAAFADLISTVTTKVTDTDGTTVTGVKFTSTLDGSNGNSETISGLQGSIRHYDIDFSTWLAGKGDAGNLPAYLDYKGFRAYCATCTDQWFNFEFINGIETLQDKPASGVGINDIKSIIIDVSKVTDAKSLVKAIYDQGTTALDKLNHNLHLAMNEDKGILTLYDERTTDLETLYGSYYQKPGPKIADGILDNVVRQDRNVEVERLYIQHTDKSSRNIMLDIPKTSLDHIFSFIPSNAIMKQYTVMTKENRENLLGYPPADGILDQGIQYLTDANTLIGAQINHLAHARDNIVTQRENVTSAESVIRDTDMASAMTSYTKENVLAQAAQAMLAQANSNSQNTLKLLQG